MSVGGISGSSSALLRHLRSVQSSSAIQSLTGDTDDTQSAQTLPQSSVSSSSNSKSKGTSLLEQLAAAVKKAVSSQTDSSSPEDLFKSIEEAIQSTFASNGIDPAQAKGPPGGPPAGGPPPGGPPPGGPPPGGRGGSGGGASSASAVSETSSTSNSSSLSTLEEMLKQLGIDATTFKSDLLSATASAQNSGSSQLDPSKLYQSFRPGQALNVLA